MSHAIRSLRLFLLVLGLEVINSSYTFLTLRPASLIMVSISILPERRHSRERARLTSIHGSLQLAEQFVRQTMVSRIRWLIFAIVASTVTLASGTPAGTVHAQQSKATVKKTVAKAKLPRRVTALHLYKVQARNPLWQVSGVTNKAAAKTVARRLRSQGWSAHVTGRKGQAAVKFRMLRWRTKAVVTGGAQAQAVANTLRAQRVQSRVLKIK